MALTIELAGCVLFMFLTYEVTADLWTHREIICVLACTRAGTKLGTLQNDLPLATRCYPKLKADRAKDGIRAEQHHAARPKTANLDYRGGG
jgi:hypothetical protein